MDAADSIMRPRTNLDNVIPIFSGLCWVCLVGKNTAGYWVWEDQIDYLELKEFFVKPLYRRQGFGTEMWNRFRGMHDKPISIVLEPYNIDGQLFFKSVGARCVTFADDRYIFSHRL